MGVEKRDFRVIEKVMGPKHVQQLHSSKEICGKPRPVKKKEIDIRFDIRHLLFVRFEMYY